MPDHLFVFGTLLSGHDHPMARLVAQSCDLVGPAHAQGRLYLAAHYPGMVLSDDPAEQVFGELYRMRDAEGLLRVLDDYEGFGATQPQPNEFVRERVRVTLDQARGGEEAIEAWTYLFNRPVTNLPRILSGRFLDH